MIFCESISSRASISGQDAVRVKSFDFQGIQIHDTDFVMSDLSHLLEDEEIYGLIGYQVIKDYDWLFDYANKTLTLIKPDKTTDYISQMQYATYEISLQMASKTSHIPTAKEHEEIHQSLPYAPYNYFVHKEAIEG